MDSRVPSPELVEQLRGGDETAAAELHGRFVVRLCRLAEQQMSDRLRRRVDPDDVVQSVFRTFFRRAELGEFSINDSGSLWSLLAKITLNKVRRYAERHGAAKRDAEAEVYPDASRAFAMWLDREPSHEEAALLVEECEALTQGLTPLEARIVQMCLEGHSTPEIATTVGSSRWTVRRILLRIGERLRARASEESSD